MKLQALNLIKRYSRNVVDDLSLEVSQGEIVGILGPNGAGKTTSFNMIVGIVSPSSGCIILDDKDITHMPMYQRARVGIGYLPQEASVFRGLTVEENILAPLELNKSLSRKERYKRVEELMSDFSITHIRKSKGKVLSGGERRRVELARLLAISPKFVLLDEPFAGVDPLAVMEIQSLIYQLKQSNIGILITDHNVNETLSITDNSYLIFNGKVLMHGTPEELVANEDVKNLYLGSNFVLNKKKTNL